MILRLPRNLAPLAKLTGDSSRFSGVTAVHLTAPPGQYRAEATNGRILAIVQGPNDHPTVSLDGYDDILVPADFWAAMAKAGDPRRNPLVEMATTSPEELTAGTNGGTITGPYFHSADIPNDHKNRERFPKVDQIIPKSAPIFRIAFDPGLMKKLLDVASALDLGRVELVIFAADQPMGLQGRNDQGQTFDALIVPLTSA